MLALVDEAINSPEDQFGSGSNQMSLDAQQRIVG